jgi:hypothetical protein
MLEVLCYPICGEGVPLTVLTRFRERAKRETPFPDNRQVMGPQFDIQPTANTKELRKDWQYKKKGI